ncbi:MAG: hypothetical protein H7250_03255 [Flavobacterium sp.]|nr:hypothetical protein [Flavobacterium sp.]
MKFKNIILIFTSILTGFVYSQNATEAKKQYNQIILLNYGILGLELSKLGDFMMPQYGFLAGSKFPTYDTTKQFDFKNIKMKVVISDEREKLKLSKIECSKIDLKNKSEFRGNQGTVKLWQYLNYLLPKSNIIIDSTSTNELIVSLNALDSRLIGFGQIEVHGLCQMDFKYKGITKSYCTDIEDGDPTAPLQKSSFVTRKTAARYMTSASIRETFEKFFNDLTDWK